MRWRVNSKRKDSKPPYEWRFAFLPTRFQHIASGEEIILWWEWYKVYNAADEQFFHHYRIREDDKWFERVEEKAFKDVHYPDL